MKKLLAIALGTVGLASFMASPASAQIAGLSANAAVTTNYVFRGISQSGSDPAVQGGLDYNVGTTGLAFGTWASSIDFGNTGGEDNAPLEWDVYGSYTYAFSDAFSLSAGAIGYLYPNTATGQDYNWYEGW